MLPMSAPHPTFAEALRFWFKLGLISFGGPSGQIAIMHTELVDKKRWIGEERFLHALNYCMLLPGPEATQLATYCGWLLHRTWGGIAAGVLFVLPSAFLLWALSYVYVMYGQLPWLAAAFGGLKPAVAAIVAAAVVRVGQRTLKTPLLWVVAAAAFISIFWFKVPFPIVVTSALLLGLFGGKAGFLTASPPPAHIPGSKAQPAAIADDAEAPAHTRPTLARAVKVLTVSLVLWWVPVLAAALMFGRTSTLAQEGVFFSKAAVITFGGAYSVLPYVGQQAVEMHGWLSTAQMMDGLGLAETTPGPLIMVLQFVGFLGGWNQPGGLTPLLAATLGAAMTTWTTFVPSFLFIFLGAPHIEQLRGVVWLHHALSAVTAAVVGVILNLAVWFALHVFAPNGAPIDWISVAIAVLAFVAQQRFKTSVTTVVFASALLGLARHALTT